MLLLFLGGACHTARSSFGGAETGLCQREHVGVYLPLFWEFTVWVQDFTVRTALGFGVWEIIIRHRFCNTASSSTSSTSWGAIQEDRRVLWISNTYWGHVVGDTQGSLYFEGFCSNKGREDLSRRGLSDKDTGSYIYI